MRAIIFAMLLTCSCSSDSTGAVSGAQLRYIARDIYALLNNPSCSALKGFDRHALLKGEITGMENFSREIDGTLAAQQLAIAQQDANFEQEADSRCWFDDDIRFADKHVQMGREAFQAGLPKLRSLSGKLHGSQIEYLVQPHNRAKFRYFAKKLVESSRPMCPIATGNRDDKIMASARKEVDHFQQTLGDGPFAPQFEIAEADVDFLQSITQVECGDPSNESTDKLASQILEEVRGQIALVRKAMN